MKRKRKTSFCKSGKIPNKKCRNEKISSGLSVVQVAHHDSLISTNWEKLSEIVGYDPNYKKSPENTIIRVKKKVSKKLNHINASHQKRPVTPVAASSKLPSPVPNDSKHQEEANESLQNHENGSQGGNSSLLQPQGPVYEPKLLTRAIAMDCEMVGTGPSGNDSMLARISIVNSLGHCVYDKHVLPKIKVTDYRTSISGIRPKDLKNGEKFETVQQEVAEILKGRILVGHALKNDFKVLYFSHPRRWVRDTSVYKPFHKMCGSRMPSLKKLAAVLLNATIQTGEHDSVEDARTAMQIYTLYKKEWEVHERRKKHKKEESKND